MRGMRGMRGMLAPVPVDYLCGCPLASHRHRCPSRGQATPAEQRPFPPLPPSHFPYHLRHCPMLTPTTQHSSLSPASQHHSYSSTAFLQHCSPRAAPSHSQDTLPPHSSHLHQLGSLFYALLFSHKLTQLMEVQGSLATCSAHVLPYRTYHPLPLSHTLLLCVQTAYS